MTTYNLMESIMDDSQRYSGLVKAKWRTQAGAEHTSFTDSRLLGRELYLADRVRIPKTYPRQRNYHGLYYFSQLQRHVWHESLLEANMLMLLDHTQDIVAISSQPMQLSFADGLTHIPDFLALHGNDRQVLYDVKPTKYINAKVLEQFAKTQAVCESVGWGYQVLTGLDDQVQQNLSWLSLFMHSSFTAPADAVAALHEQLAPCLPFGDAAKILGCGDMARGRAALFHLLWRRLVGVDMTSRISDNSLIERTPHGHA